MNQLQCSITIKIKFEAPFGAKNQGGFSMLRNHSKKFGLLEASDVIISERRALCWNDDVALTAKTIPLKYFR